MTAYYNEWEPYCAEWLRNLIKEGLIADGEVDERSIADVEPGDLSGFTQCHFFAGIGGWSLGLRMAGWDDSRPVWTGSCPCQPFSQAGKGKGTADERHLWPEFARLIGERNPTTVFGEQVASPAGRQWLAGVRLEMERMGYAVGAADLCAAGVYAPDIRQRLWWVGDANNPRSQKRRVGLKQKHVSEKRENAERSARLSGSAGRMADDRGAGREMAGHNKHDLLPVEGWEANIAGRNSDDCGLQHPASAGRQQRRAESSSRGEAWSDAIWIPCADGKSRRIKPGIEPLAHGVSARVGKLRAYGNAIVPQVAAEFINAYMD